MILVVNQHTVPVFSNVVVSFRLVIVAVTLFSDRYRRRPGFNSPLKRLLFCHLHTFCCSLLTSSLELCVNKQQTRYVSFA